MSDATTRRLERSAPADPKLLVLALRRGDLCRDRVHLAARLGNPRALALYPDADPVNWSTCSAERRLAIKEAASLLGKTLPARVAADWAGRALPAWEAEHSDDDRPRKAIEAARAWAKCPCEKHLQAAGAAYAAAEAAADEVAIRSLAAAAAYAANAAYAAYAAADAAAYAANAAYSDAYSAYATAEQEWQRLRLAAYLLGDL